MSRVQLAKIPALTFYKGEWTQSRRTEPLPQLTCVGKPCKLFTPDVVRCESLGGSGTDIDWKCHADLPDSLRLGRVSVSCEGFSKPGDPWVLKDSCALEYRLVQVPKSLRDSDSDNYLHNTPSEPLDVASILFYLLWIGVCAMIAFALFRSCFGDRNDHAGAGRGERPGGPGPRPGAGRPAFFPGGMDHDTDDAPPPYSKMGQGMANQDGWRPGFWTGAALGGLGAHLLNNRQGGQRTYDWERERYRHQSGSGGWFARDPPSRRPDDRGEGSSNLGAMRQSTGFGGSNVR
ncbi:unnamed protein product [Mycena citricolor]|uniref:Store-operated calcium entry-associated regulatory factor n=1 Tax=Mycena citricolor TaxID=2018698 RepID=A0AAD2H579_9AGAR|nr:unnamed protein product [Mycena citricolor]